MSRILIHHTTPTKKAEKCATARLALAGLLLAALTLPSAPALAATTTTTFNVTATVLAKCTISAANLAFGSYDATAANLDASSAITVKCNNGKTYDVGLNAGSFSGATVSARSMSGTDPAGLAYTLYRETGRTSNWGNTVSSDTVSGTGNGSNQTLIVYGRIPTGQFVTAGSYSDTITATITF